VGDPVTARVLVVEDDSEIRQTVVDVLRAAGHACSAASNGREAIDLLRAAVQLPDVVLLDLRMPVLDGAGFRGEQLLDPRLAPIPVIVVSANVRVGEEAEALGAAGHLRKPFGLDELQDALARFGER
jgi:two-component system chemotaxis response regulator CheY